MWASATGDHSRGQGHISRSPHSTTKQVEHPDRHGASECDVRIGEGGRQHLVLSAHPAKDVRRCQQHGGGEKRRESQSQKERVMNERVSAVASSRT